VAAIMNISIVVVMGDPGSAAVPGPLDGTFAYLRYLPRK
jgi:hypothetical protein